MDDLEALPVTRQGHVTRSYITRQPSQLFQGFLVTRGMKAPGSAHVTQLKINDRYLCNCVHDLHDWHDYTNSSTLAIISTLPHYGCFCYYKNVHKN